MHKQETPGAVAPVSTTSATNRASTRQTEALSAATFDTTIARGDHHVMASQAISKDSAFLNTIAATPTGSPALQHEPNPGAENDELEEGEILNPEDEFAALSDNHSEAESNHTADTQNTTNNHSSSESEPFVVLFGLEVRHTSSRTLKVDCIILLPQLELLGNLSLIGRPDIVTACVAGDWYIKKLRPMLIGAFIGEHTVVGHRLTTFSGTNSQALRRKYIKDDSYGKRRLLEDHVQVVADHHRNQTPVPKVQQCYDNGETQLHWSGQDPPRKKACFVSLIDTSTYAMGEAGVVLLGSLSPESCANFLAMRNAYQPKLFQPKPPQEPKPSLKRKRDASDDSKTSRLPPSSAFDRPSTHRVHRVHHGEPEDLTKTSVLRPALPSHFPDDLRNKHADVRGRTSAAAVSPAVGSYTNLAIDVERLGHSSQHSTLLLGASAQLQPTENGHQNSPEDVQNGGNANTKNGKPWCTYCHQPNHTEDDCWTKNPSKKPAKSQKASLARPPPRTIVHGHHININRGDGIFAGSYGRESVPQRPGYSFWQILPP